ncbi:hypothetical protein M3P21_21090 [Ruegeria sp. 2012CJ41-6]|uniref:DNA transfer protein n=1 Tax=Ruegeria spongiae TaxID=2942209 RepID=A0ABT0Q810_9RHOB|nr:hypothetical protein [Ruegeria spongiae]MCL6286015.1 hypothetical protein [Ruegeria spongiae]
MSSGGSKSTTTVQKADPWSGAQPYLKRGLKEAESLFDQGGFSPEVYQGNRVAGFGDITNQAQGMTMSQAMGPNATAGATNTLQRMMDPDYTSGQLDQVKQNALESAIPAATSMFSGSGMLNSSQAMDTVGRAAAEAVAPIEYGAHQAAQNRAMQAAEMAPKIDLAGYMPAQMVGQVGSAQDALAQSQINSDMQVFSEGANADAKNLSGFAGMVYPGAGMGSQSTATGPGGGPSTGAQIAGAGLAGLGTYGALTAPAALGGLGLAGPLGIAGGGLAALAGLL